MRPLRLKWLVAAGFFISPFICTAEVPSSQSGSRASLQGVVYAIDGSGHLRAMTKDLRSAVAKANLPLEVEQVDWSHGSGRIFSDLHDQAHHHDQGTELGGKILARRRATPGAGIFLVCHSSGAAVALAAAEALPVETLDRIILLAPAVSASYDLRPALRSTRAGMDVFYSRKDLISLSLNLVGTTDGRYFASAGTGGFDVPAGEYANLRQISWKGSMTRSGNYGGHFGFTRVGFFEESIVPLLSTATGR